MKTVCGSMAAVLTSLVLCAQAPTGVKPPEVAWVSLFNGKDLTGWVKVGNERWDVEDGAIHGRGVSKEYGYRRTEKKYKDFDLAIRFKCEADGNSSVFFHCEFKPDRPSVSQGLQFDIDRRLRHNGGLYGDGRAWIVWPPPELDGAMKPNDWNDFLLSVHGNRYISRLNGITMVDFTDPAPRSFDGYIALQLHSGGLGDMKFKEILIRDVSRR